MNNLKVLDNITDELKKYLAKNPSIKSLIIGVSGGIDSALCCAIANYAIRDLDDIILIGRSIPISSNMPDEIDRAKLVGKAFCDDFQEKDVTSAYEHLTHEIEAELIEEETHRKTKIRRGNIKARLRMMYLYNLAQERSGLVLSTDNMTEFLLGFWTLHGDVGDLGMIQELWKTEVYELSDWVATKSSSFNSEQKAAMKSCVECDPTDGLGISGTDLDQIMPGWNTVFENSRQGYEYVDIVLQDKTELYPQFIEKINDRYFKTHFKRNNPFNFGRSDILKK